ncbi:hypothetical protein B0A50_03628 [Salinomyces thailandicus]|uniref:guanosine-diphosphatase n=1 Tax=Salinomyces thailandicus TaxID=706561 RepID=A0A4U0U2K1_9PEZI|nr:hypothetical protein B0A50_03628 [Salinomyces thailandica]
MQTATAPGPSNSYWAALRDTLSPRPRRRSSATHRERSASTSDPHEKRDRHTTSGLSRSSETPPRSMQEKLRAAWMNSSQRARYIKTGCLIAFALLCLYYITGGSGKSTAPASTWRGSTLPNVETTLKGGDTASSPELATAKCTKSYSKEKPLIQYAIMIDAGSTGSRIHVYRFNNCGPTPELESEEFKMTEKKEGGSGLSSFKSDAEGAARSLDPLLAVAMEKVPEKLKSCTPIAVKATAGLRKLGGEMSEAILKAVRNRLETAYPFAVVSAAKGGVEVMDGKDEGVYAWITTNYLLGNIGTPADTPTAAVFDLGGGSTQIVFQPTFPSAHSGSTQETLAPGDHKYSLTFGGRAFDLYQHSYLGYGLMEARSNLHRLVLDNTAANHPTTSTTWLTEPLTNPCLLPGTAKEISLDLPSHHPLYPSSPLTLNMTGPHPSPPSTPDTASPCLALTTTTLNKTEPCSLPPCAFNGVHQPPLPATLPPKNPIYLFSYFYDRVTPLGLPATFTLADLSALTTRVCAGSTSKNWDVFDAVPGAREELEGRPESCLDLSYMVSLLREGYGMGRDREVRVAKTLGGNELGWCLGASLPLLEGGTCGVEQVA